MAFGVAAITADITKYVFALYHLRVSVITLWPHTQQRHVFHQIIQMLTRQLPATAGATTLNAATVRAGEYRCHYAHIGIQRCRNLMPHTGSSRFITKAAQPGVTALRISYPLCPAGNTITIAVVFIFQRQYG